MVLRLLVNTFANAFKYHAHVHCTIVHHMKNKVWCNCHKTYTALNKFLQLSFVIPVIAVAMDHY